MPDSAIERPARWVQDEAEIAELAATILDPSRERLVVCVTKQPARDLPMVDPDRIAGELGEKVDVWVVTDSAHAWALTDALPPKIDVYGGAVRAWAPIPHGKEIFPSDHPQWTVFTPEDEPRVVEQIQAFVRLSDDPPPPFGSEAMATVTAVRKAGAELLLDSGHEAFASSQHLVQHGQVFHAREILLPGQQVQVRVGPWHAQAAKVSVSLRDFAPDPWERLGEVYSVGDVVDGVVIRLQPYGAFVELLPGVEGLLHLSRISDQYVEYVEDFLHPGDRVTVTLLSIETDRRKAEMSIVDVPKGAEPLPPASIYPGGPPWLPDSPEAFEGDPEDEQPEGFHQQRKAAEGDAAAGGEGSDAPAAGRAPEPWQLDALAGGPITAKFVDALGFMVEAHGAQARKDPAATPYVAHLMSVSALVIEHGGDETDAIAALLHDAIEDAGGVEMEARLEERFGSEVARIVRDVSDTDEDPKPPWRARKEAYLAHLAGVDERALRISAADKLHNARALLADFRRDGELLWDRFNAGRDDQLWVYGEYGEAFTRRLEALGASDGRTAELVSELRATVTQLAGLVADAAAAQGDADTEAPAATPSLGEESATKETVTEPASVETAAGTAAQSPAKADAQPAEAPAATAPAQQLALGDLDPSDETDDETLDRAEETAESGPASAESAGAVPDDAQ